MHAPYIQSVAYRFQILLIHRISWTHLFQDHLLKQRNQKKMDRKNGAWIFLRLATCLRLASDRTVILHKKIWTYDLKIER